MSDINRGLEKSRSFDASLLGFPRSKDWGEASYSFLQFCTGMRGNFANAGHLASTLWSLIRFNLNKDNSRWNTTVPDVWNPFVINLSSRLHKIPKPASLHNWLRSPLPLCTHSSPTPVSCVTSMSTNGFLSSLVKSIQVFCSLLISSVEYLSFDFYNLTSERKMWRSWVWQLDSKPVLHKMSILLGKSGPWLEGAQDVTAVSPKAHMSISDANSGDQNFNGFILALSFWGLFLSTRVKYDGGLSGETHWIYILATTLPSTITKRLGFN